MIRRNILGEADDFYQKALEEHRKGSWLQAIGHLEDCTSLAPEQQAYLALLAELKFESGDYTGAYEAAKSWCKNDKSQKRNQDLRGEKMPTSGDKESNFGGASSSTKKDKTTKNDKTQRILILSILNQNKPPTSQAYDMLNKYFEVEDPQYHELRAMIDNVQLKIDAGKVPKKTDPKFSDEEDME